MPKFYPYPVLLVGFLFTKAALSQAPANIIDLSSFPQKTDFATGTNSITVAKADLNHDGRLDLVVANYGGSTISVLINTGSTPLSFAKTDYALPGKATSVAAADVDGDGKPDLVATSETNTVSIFRNIGTAAAVVFEAPVTLYTSYTYAEGVAVGDLDGDGKPDIAVTNNQSNTVSVFKNTGAIGTISFASPQAQATGQAPQSVAIADLNGDGKAELLVTNFYGNSVSIYRNTAVTGSFAFTRTDLTTGVQPYSLAIGDLDGDGKPELLTGGDMAGTVSIFQNSSDSGSAINFTNRQDLPAGFTPYGIAIGDLDGDGRPDIATTGYSDNTIAILQNKGAKGTISFLPKVILATGQAPYSILMTDMNGDGLQDLVTADFGSSGSVSVLLNNLPLPSTTPRISSFSPLSGPVGTNVLIKGRYFDRIAAKNMVYFSGIRAVIQSATDSTLSVVVPAGASYSPITVTADSLSCISTLSFTVSFPGGQAAFSTHSFNWRADSVFGNNPRSILLPDWDGDGRADLFVTNQGGGSGFFHNTGTGNLIQLSSQEGGTVTNGVQPYGAATADFDGDGRMDIAFTDFNQTSAVYLLKNLSTSGHMAWAVQRSLPAGNSATGIAAGDIDGDGRPDLAVAVGNSFYIAIYKNTTIHAGDSLSFSNVINLPDSYHGDDVAIADLDGDGRPELIVTDFSSNLIRIWHNTNQKPGVVSFDALPQTIEVDQEPTSLAVADLSGDGVPDLLVSNYGGNNFSYLRNSGIKGVISFSPKQDFNTLIHPFKISVGDLDGDGLPDVAVAGGELQGAIAVYKNNSSGGNFSLMDPVDYPTGYSPTCVTIGDLDGDGKADLAVGNNYAKISIARNTSGEPTVVPSGAHPVSGPVTTRVYMDSTVQTYDSSVYVQRHYEIEPAENAATATATITLYFTQEDFDHFNAQPGHGSDLPTGPGDASGIANLRVYQFHGTSSVGDPGSHQGSAAEIDPVNSNIVWDPITQSWSVTFDVTGFSGFFIGGEGWHLAPPPITTDKLTIYPNPASDMVTIAFPAGSSPVRVSLTDMMGRVVAVVSAPASSSSVQLSVRGLAAGVYKMRWQQGDHRETRNLLVK